MQLADINLRKAQRAAENDLATARQEAADYEEERRFNALTPKQQMSELNASIAQKERELASMSESDPAAVAKAQREVTELKRKRDSIADGARGEGFDDYVADTIRAGPRMSMSKSARRFRGMLGPSFADKLTASQFGGGGADGAKQKTAEEQLAALQGTANGYLAVIAAKVQTLGIKE